MLQRVVGQDDSWAVWTIDPAGKTNPERQARRRVVAYVSFPAHTLADLRGVGRSACFWMQLCIDGNGRHIGRFRGSRTLVLGARGIVSPPLCYFVCWIRYGNN